MQRLSLVLGVCLVTGGCPGPWFFFAPAAHGAGLVLACSMHDDIMDRALARHDVREADESLTYLRLNCARGRYEAAYQRYQLYFHQQREQEAFRRCQPTVNRINVSWRNSSFRAQADQVRALCQPRDVDRQIAERAQSVEAGCQMTLQAIIRGDKARCAAYASHCAPEDVKTLCGAP